MKQLLAISLLSAASAPHLLAGTVPTAPEASLTTAAGALTLVSGAILVLRSRRRK